MQLAAIVYPSANAHYRALDPLKAMARRGHRVVWPVGDGSSLPAGHRFADFDVVHVYRLADAPVRRLVRDLVAAGVAVTYDNDDDFSATPKESPTYKAVGGLNAERLFGVTAQVARRATVCTTTNDVLAEKYRRAGAERVEVIGNYLAPDVDRPTRRHDGIVIGWFAAAEHRVDTARIPIAQALERVLAAHDDVRVECIGIDLALSRRYRHERRVAFEELPARIGGWDIGIAPLADIPWNRARSDIKVKEYAASGVPWVASPVQPYLGLGEEQGGRLVADDQWFEALDRLVSSRRERKRLSRRARAWASRQTIDAVADRWEAVFSSAAAGREST